SQHFLKSFFDFIKKPYLLPCFHRTLARSLKGFDTSLECFVQELHDSNFVEKQRLFSSFLL
ncbi:hypothetical protein, partial [Priestia megaterium]|uniref:hypothetical protein n=1 Tax=Priestia megaterium TaxID=1404 RepID=UPI00300BEF71